jgi:hypothetical protein
MHTAVVKKHVSRIEGNANANNTNEIKYNILEELQTN